MRSRRVKWLAACAFVAGALGWFAPMAAADDAMAELQLHNCDAAPVSPSTLHEAEYRPGIDDPAQLGALGVVAVRLSYQCAGDTEEGAHVPAGWRIDLVGPCEEGPCTLGTGVLTPDFSGKSWVGSLRDPVGFRAIKLSRSKGQRLVLTIRTRTGSGIGPRARHILHQRQVLVPTPAPEATASPVRSDRPLDTRTDVASDAY